jgi:Cu2+-exporting ATPase
VLRSKPLKEVVLEAGRLLRGSLVQALERFLLRHPGMRRAEASYMSETVTVSYDESEVSEADVRALIEEFGCCCRGEASGLSSGGIGMTGLGRTHP